MEQIRSFIAIELPEKQQKYLSHLQSIIKKDTGISARWVNPYGIHLTLKFLGNITPPQVEEIRKAMESAVQGTPPLQLEIRGLGVFPNTKKIQVIWVGLSGDTDKLGQLQKRVDDNLAKLGFPPEERAFTPHLTLARVRDRVAPDVQQKLEQLIAGIQFDDSKPFSADSVNLMKSQLTAQGAIYSRLHSVPLAE